MSRGRRLSVLQAAVRGVAEALGGRKSRVGAIIRRPTLESLETRQMLTALYWDTSSDTGLQAGNGAWSLTATNWNTAEDGSGERVAWN